jgi:hypothetical protein
VYTYTSTEGGDMHDQPEPTEQEQERAPEEMEDQEAMQYPGHEDRPDVEEAHDA